VLACLIPWPWHARKRKEKTALAVTATASDSAAGVSLERQSKCKHKAQTPPAACMESYGASSKHTDSRGRAVCMRPHQTHPHSVHTQHAPPTSSSCAKAACSGCRWYSALRHCATVVPWNTTTAETGAGVKRGSRWAVRSRTAAGGLHQKVLRAWGI